MRVYTDQVTCPHIYVFCSTSFNSTTAWENKQSNRGPSDKLIVLVVVKSSYLFTMQILNMSYKAVLELTGIVYMKQECLFFTLPLYDHLLHLCKTCFKVLRFYPSYIILFIDIKKIKKSNTVTYLLLLKIMLNCFHIY